MRCGSDDDNDDNAVRVHLTSDQAKQLFCQYAHRTTVSVIILLYHYYTIIYLLYYIIHCLYYYIRTERKPLSSLAAQKLFTVAEFT